MRTGRHLVYASKWVDADPKGVFAFFDEWANTPSEDGIRPRTVITHALRSFKRFSEVDAYGIVFDPPTVLLLLRTGLSSARDLVSAGLLLAVLVLGIAPGAWLISQRSPVAQRLGTRLRNNLLSFALGAATAACFGLIVFSDHFSAMREHEELRYMVTPLAAAYSVGAAAIYSRGDQSGPTFIVAAMRSCCRQHRGPNQLCCCWMPAKRHVP